jgi:formylglycine-generating enzyme required for sulfatase activity
VIAAELIALLVMALSPAASQATYIQEPVDNTTDTEGDEGDTAAAAPRGDIRLVLRQTAGDEPAVPPPGMVEIPRGVVAMGTPVENLKTSAKMDEVLVAELLAETPRHSVDLGAYYIDLTEVTNLQWKVYLDATGRKASSTLIEFGWPTGDVPEGQEHFPITNVNLPEIRDFLTWCGKRLPDEAEWTRAARGDDVREYPWGDKWDAKFCQSAMSTPPVAIAVGSHPEGASPFGVLDMAGNVFEWVDSPFAAYPGFQPLSLEGDKKKKGNTLTPQFNSSSRVIKGGSFTTIKQFTRIDVRLGQAPIESDAALGFRCVRSKTPGLEAIRNGLRQLANPAAFVKVGLDETDIVAREIDSYDDARKVITGYRYLAFAHRAPVKGPSLTQLRKTSRDEFLPLGVLVTSEALRMPDMDDAATIERARGMPNATPEQKTARESAIARAERALPAGEYALLFKAEGESKAFKERQKNKGSDDGKDDASGDDDEKRQKEQEAEKAAAKAKKSRNGKDRDEDKAPADDEPAAAAPGEVMVPWPGLASIHDIEEDVDYPQDIDLILFLNANNKVVGYAKPLEITEQEVQDVASTRSDDGKQWTIDFSLNQQSKKGPRFKLGLELVGPGL